MVTQTKSTLNRYNMGLGLLDTTAEWMFDLRILTNQAPSGVNTAVDGSNYPKLKMWRMTWQKTFLLLVNAAAYHTGLVTPSTTDVVPFKSSASSNLSRWAKPILCTNINKANNYQPKRKTFTKFMLLDYFASISIHLNSDSALIN